MKNTLAKISSGALTTYVAFSGFVGQAFAQKSASDWLGGIDGVDSELDSWIITMLNWAIGLAALAAVAMLVAAGFMYITANGDEGKVEKATKSLTFAIVGLVVCFIAVMVVQFVLTNILK
jgi:cytochrome bd-type quinol oxidase subunit 2